MNDEPKSPAEMKEIRLHRKRTQEVEGIKAMAEIAAADIAIRKRTETLRALLVRYFERMKTIVERHGGSVEKFIGDAVMAVFGVPVVHEDDALRAVRAAVEMRDAFPELGVEGRIGVTTGEVVTGTEERLGHCSSLILGEPLARVPNTSVALGFAEQPPQTDRFEPRRRPDKSPDDACGLSLGSATIEHTFASP